MFLLEGIDGIQAFIDEIKAFGVELHVVFQHFDFRDQVVEVDISRPEPLADFLGTGEITLQRIRCGIRLFDELDAAHLLAVQQLRDLVERALDFLGVGERFLLLFQFLLLAGGEVSLLQLIQLETDVVFFLLGLGSLLLQLLQLLLQSLVAGIFLAVEDEQDFILRHDIDHAQLETVVAQQEILVLGMNVNQFCPQFLHNGEGNRGIVHECTRFAGGV